MSVLGAFVAGVVLRRWAPGNLERLEQKLDAIGYGFFIPIFFISSGMGLDVQSILDAPARLFAALPPAARRPRAADPAGVPDRAPRARRFELVFIVSTALPLLVALSEIGLETGHMLPENAAALVGAGVLSVLVYPAIAVAIDRRLARTRDPLDEPQL